VLVNGQVLRQRLTLSGQRPAMTNVVWDSTTDGASLDEVRITTNVPPGLTSNLNQNAMNDADELQTYGYCARILAVGAGQTYTSLTGAVANARDRDILRVAAGAYTGDVTVACSLFFVGEAFTIQGNLNVSDGLTVQATNAITCSGSVTLNTNSMLIVSNGALAASTLGIATGATVRIVNGTLAADGTALTTGTYTLDYRWGTFVTQTLPFADTFEAYSAGQAVSALGWFGWSVGGVGAEVEATNTYTNLSTRAVAMPSGSAVYVTIDPGSQEKVWSDVWVQPVLGDEPVGSGASLLMYFNADGYLVVSNAAVVGGWDVCTNDFFGASVAPVVVGDWVRLTVRQDYASPQNGAIFLRGRLLRQQLGFFGAPPHFSKIRVGDASVGVTFMDDISVSTNMPVAMPWSDGDGDGTQDAQEIDRRGDVRLFPHGTVFKFR
jgi:hypothetical protein